jgi:putative OmpL-like beta-barrel porin-2
MRHDGVGNELSHGRRPDRLRSNSPVVVCTVLLTALACVPFADGQEKNDARYPNQDLRARVSDLEAEVKELREIVKQLQAANSSISFRSSAVVVATDPVATAGPRALALGDTSSQASPNQALSSQAASNQASSSAAMVSPEDAQNLAFLRGTTINLALDGYYEYNFNHPVGRVNLLRDYDVLSNNFSLNQANLVVEDLPHPEAGQRWGGRLDLQFGQATDTLQGNPLNEPRPDIYRNIFQAYGTYVVPVGKGLNVDFGKWSSSLGIEGNYSKDQINYSRSYFFGFLPFYHMGVRASYPVNDSFTVNYWVVNGTNQAEATNAFKDELFGFTAKPRKTITWTFNYYLGQENPDRVEVPPYLPIPVQPGLSFVGISPAPNGRTHIFDSYTTWQATPKLTFALEGDYEIERVWQNASPGESSAPKHVDGGVAYAKYQLASKVALGARAEYLSDRGGLFSGLTQALKENTVTFDYSLADGFLMRYEWRRDFSNQPSFLTDVQGILGKQQNTATVGLMWWWGRKEGAW